MPPSRARHSVLSLGLVLLALAAGACGSSSSSSSHSGAAAGSKGKPPPAKSKTGFHGHTYHLKLTGKAETPPGAPKGTGAAVIALHSSLNVCWRFSHLHGFTAATFAHIHRGAAGTSGPIVIPLSTTPKLRHAGCVRSNVGLLKAIEKDPHAYYVNIHSRQYPGGAVRSQL